MGSGNDKKQKKKLQQAKNRKRFIINQQLEVEEENRRMAEARAQALRDGGKTATKPKPEVTHDDAGNPIWSAKMQEVKNRITGKKRMAKDRWNRFAGTSSAGAMGR
jgi:hypothetical protein